MFYDFGGNINGKRIEEIAGSDDSVSITIIEIQQEAIGPGAPFIAASWTFLTLWQFQEKTRHFAPPKPTLMKYYEDQVLRPLF